MVKHIICLKLKEFAEGNHKAENVRLAAEKLLELKNKIKEIKSIEVGLNSPHAPADNFDLVLYTEFGSFADLDAYQKHPEHLKVADFIKRVRETRACVDFET